MYGMYFDIIRVLLKNKIKIATETGNKPVLSHDPVKYNYLSYTVFKGLLKTPKHDTKKDKPVSIYMYSLL